MKLNVKNCAIALGIAVSALAATPRQADAALFINFDQNTALVGNFGSVTSLGGGNWKGTDITFNIITLQDTTLGTLAAAYCGSGNTKADSCLLNFDTSTGSFVLTAPAGITSNGVTGIAGLGAGVVVMTATTPLVKDFTPGVGLFSTLSLSAFDDKAPELISYFSSFGLTGSSLGFSSTNQFFKAGGAISNADLSNFQDFRLVPEPGMLTLFGLGLLGVGRRFRNRR